MRISCRPRIPGPVSRTLIALLLVLSTGLVGRVVAQGNSAPSRAGRSGTLFEQTVEEGVLLVDGQFVQPPYVIEASGNNVTVNGLDCFEVTTRNHQKKSESDSRRRRRSSDMDDDVEGDYENPRSARRAAEGMAETLEGSNIVVVVPGGRPRLIRSGSAVFTFCDAMLAEKPSPQQVEDFLQIGGREGQSDFWRTLLTESSPSGLFRDRLQTRLDEIQANELEGIARHNALTRMETFSYPLTLAGMLVGVIALGHVLKWTARSIVAEQREDYAPEVTRCVEIALLLMLVMSAIDLTWTILAGQAGVMREVNPLAAGYIQSPLQLIVLKVFATGLGCGILYVWRQRRQVQNATWWMCLVCVLLTFRWVVFDSVIS